MKNVYLIQVVDSYGPNKFLPLAIGYQWCYAKNDNCVLRDVLIEKIPIADYVKTINNPNIVAMSSYVWNWEYNQELAKKIKHYWPNCTIVVGGPQVDKTDHDFFQKYPFFDLAVHGEGEQAFREILARDNNFDGIPGVQTPTYMPDPVKRLTSVADIPSPILEGFYDPIIAKYPANTLWQVTWESLRGCPYHCAFCDIGDSYWNKLTLFDIDRCKAEIDWMARNKIEYVSVCDSNWGMLDRDFELTQYVIDTKEKYGYPKWWDATWSKNNLDKNYSIAMLDKKHNANLFKGVTFAMQSFNDSTLKATERFNQSNEALRSYLEKYKNANIPTYSELIWPMPNETLISLKQGIQQLIDLGQDNFLMIHPLVITYNATMGNAQYQETHGITTKQVPLDTYYLSVNDTQDYIVEKTDAVYSTSTVTWEENLLGNLYAWLLITFYYYGWGHYISKYIKNTLGVAETDFFDSLLKWTQDHNDTLLFNEYSQTRNHLIDTFNHGKFWGRRILGDDDIFWEYKGATSIVFHNNKDRLKQDLSKFLKETYNISNTDEIVRLNLLSCKDKDTVYPIKIKTDKSIAQAMFGIDSDMLIVDHHDQHSANDDSFFNRAYHWQRKLKYWQCSITDCDKK